MVAILNETSSKMGQTNSYERLKEPDTQQRLRNYTTSGIHNPLFSKTESNSWKGSTSNKNNNSWSNNSTDKEDLINKKDKK